MKQTKSLTPSHISVCDILVASLIQHCKTSQALQTVPIIKGMTGTLRTWDQFFITQEGTESFGNCTKE